MRGANSLGGNDPFANAPALDLGAQLEIALNDSNDQFDNSPDAPSQMFMQEVAILQMQAE